MDEKSFVVDGSYKGYVFVGWARGMFETKSGDKQPYMNMYVFSPVSDYQSDDFMASGYRADRKKCVSADVWKDLKPGDKVMLHFPVLTKAIFLRPLISDLICKIFATHLLSNNQTARKTKRTVKNAERFSDIFPQPLEGCYHIW